MSRSLACLLGGDGGAQAGEEEGEAGGEGWYWVLPYITDGVRVNGALAGVRGVISVAWPCSPGIISIIRGGLPSPAAKTVKLGVLLASAHRHL